MKKIFTLVTKGYNFKKSVNHCLKQPSESEEFKLAQFYKTEVDKLEDSSVDMIDKLKQQMEADKVKYMGSALATELLSNAESFLEALKAVEKNN